VKVPVGMLALLILSTGCGGSTDPSVPACDPRPSGFNSPLILMAQAVPTASQLPCVRSIPVGWEFGGVQARSGRARFHLIAAHSEGPRDLVVEVRDSCSVTGASELPSQHPAIKRYERVDHDGSAYAGVRYFVYQGGCTTVRFDLPGGVAGLQSLDTVTQSLDFVSRITLRRQVFDRSDGRLHLDPRPEPAS